MSCHQYPHAPDVNLQVQEGEKAMIQRNGTGSTASGSTALPLLPTPPLVYSKCYCEENAYLLARSLLEQIQQTKEQPQESLEQKENDNASASAASSTSVLHAEPAYSPLPEIYVMFMSSASNQLRLYRQRIGDQQRGGLVVWDYHVIVVVRQTQVGEGEAAASTPESASSSVATAATSSSSSSSSSTYSSFVYDQDTTLVPFPCPLTDYAREAFRAHLPQPNGYERLFRVIPVDEFLQHFASDRSHMLAPLSSLTPKQLQQQERPYLAPPPTYPAISTASSSNNIDEYRFIRSLTDTNPGRGVVMNQSQMLEFFGASGPMSPATASTSTKSKSKLTL